MYTSSYLRNIPKIAYKTSELDDFSLPTNIFFRIGILNSIKNNIFAYTEYRITDSDKIHILAEKVYGDQQLYWVIALANDMIDPVLDWPKDNYTFDNHIISKYGSLESAMSTVHHYEKHILRRNNTEQVESLVKLEITEANYNALAETSYQTYNLASGAAVEEIITRHSYSNYDWETTLNDEKRTIKLIKKMYIPQIQDEFEAMLRDVNGLPRGYRTIR